jgi:cyclopropane fatty-acyl-phospholipid synthase-like methyltransferase
MLAGPVKFQASLEVATESARNDSDQEKFDSAFALDVLEHIDMSEEDRFLRNVCLSLGNSATFICGMPSLESQAYASEASIKGHVNCKTGPQFKTFMSQYFGSVLMFSMNDEVLHTGFFPMSSCLFAVGVGSKIS